MEQDQRRKTHQGLNMIKNSEDQQKKTKRTTEKDSCEFYRHLSVRLNDVLDHVGASAEFRKIRQDCCISREIIQTIKHQLRKNNIATYIFGSSSEGTTIPCLNSDLDVLLCRDDHVVENIREAGDGHSYLMVRDPHTQPGYIKLQRVYNGQPQTIFTGDKEKYEKFDSEGRICLNHMSLLGINKYKIYVDERNGPADTSIKCNLDHVNAMRCSTIPEFTREWIVRNRQYKWPSKRVLDRMTSLGCFCVGVGHPVSKERDIEWRLSFSLQERELMFSMSNVQHKCYILLKIIKKDLIEPIVGKSISSYHLKTCMFHAIENTRLGFWKRENLCHCVLLCLYVMFKWVYLGYCPNYFTTEENMFDREIQKRQRSKLLHRMRFILSYGCDFLFLIKLENVGFFLQNGLSNVQIDSNVDKAIFDQKFELKLDIMLFRWQLCCQANTHNNAKTFIKMILKYVTETKSIRDHNAQQTQMAFSYILPYIHLQLAQSYASLSINTNSEEDKWELLHKSGQHLREARHCDLTSSILLKATLYFKLEQNECCVFLLDTLESKFNPRPLSICGCYERTVYHSNEHIRQIKTLPISEILSRTQTCMTFLRSDINITPDALQFEMFRSVNTHPDSRDVINDVWFNMAVIDAVVYVHFMQYLVHAKLSQRIQKHVAIYKLGSVLQSEINLGHRDTGYNLLSWIYLHENWIQRDAHYFQQSWAIRPHHNAAKLHMLKLIIKMSKRRIVFY